MSAEKTVKKKLSNVPLKIEDLIENYKRGLMAIPEFQRDYVWKPKKAPRLLDSMWNHYPIGAVLTWSTQDKVQSRIHFRVTSPTQWIIDGQQRTRTLVKISDGEIPVLFDIKNERFLLENAATKKAMDPTLIPISEIWGAQLIEVTRKFEGIAKNAKEEREFSERLDACRRLLLMEIPQVHLEGHTIEEAIAAFQRINTQGMKLKSSDITIAQLTVKHSGFVKNSVQPFIDELKRKGWDRVYVSQLFVACEGIAEKGARGEARKRLQELSTKELNESWSLLKRGINEAISLLQDELGIQDMRIFPTGALLMPAAVLLSGAVKKPPRGKEILNWMIWASLTRRYSGSAQEKLDLDIASCFSDSPIRALKRNIQKTSSRSKITANERNFDSSLNDRYAMFLTYVACYFSSMRDLFDGRRVSSSSSQWHHVIPRGSLKPKFRRALDNASNVAFILGATNRKISCIDASEYLQKISPRILQSQCIPLDRTVWKDSKDFMRARARLLTKAIAQFLDDDNSIHAFDPVNSNGK